MDGTTCRLTFAGCTFGDADGGGVDVGDLAILAVNWGQSGRAWNQGDFTGEGVVDVGDLGVLAAHWGWVRAPGDAAAAVPEPMTMLLLALGAVAMGRRHRGRAIGLQAQGHCPGT
jgi:hypothetical protein